MNTIDHQEKKHTKRSNASLPLSVEKILKNLGDNIQIARKRRGYSEASLADLAHISKQTLRRAEAGEPGIGIGVLASILFVLRLEADLGLVADPERDVQGIFLSDAKLPKRIRSKKDDQYDF